MESTDRVDFDQAHRLIDLQSVAVASSQRMRMVRRFRALDGTVASEDTVPAPPLDSLDVISFPKAGGWTAYFPRFGARALHAFGAGGQSAHAVSSRYAIEWRDASGRRRALIQQPITQGPPLSAAERAESDAFLTDVARETGRATSALGVTTPDARPPVANLGFDLDGRLWVEHEVAANAARVADLYVGAEWVARAEWPAEVYLTGYVAKDSTALGIALDRDGVERVVRLVFRSH